MISVYEPSRSNIANIRYNPYNGKFVNDRGGTGADDVGRRGLCRVGRLVAGKMRPTQQSLRDPSSSPGAVQDSGSCLGDISDRQPYEPAR